MENKIKNFIKGAFMAGLLSLTTYSCMLAIGASDGLDKSVIEYRNSHR